MKTYTFFLAFLSILVCPVYAADLVIFSYDRPLQLYALLESVQVNITGLRSTSVIYRASSADFETAYEHVHDTFPSVQFFKQGLQPQQDFKPLTLHATFGDGSPYILFAVDDIIVKDSVKIDECVTMLEQTNAYGFYLRLAPHLTKCYTLNCDQPVPLLHEVAHDVFVWTFSQGACDWGYPNTVDMTLYRKSDIRADLEKIFYATPNQLEGYWAGLSKKIMHRQGLCFATSKVVNIPINRVQTNYANRHMDAFTPQELLEVFNQQLKIDISVLSGMRNESAHQECELRFVERA